MWRKQTWPWTWVNEILDQLLQVSFSNTRYHLKKKQNSVTKWMQLWGLFSNDRKQVIKHLVLLLYDMQQVSYCVLVFWHTNLSLLCLHEIWEKVQHIACSMGSMMVGCPQFFIIEGFLDIRDKHFNLWSVYLGLSNKI